MPAGAHMVFWQHRLGLAACDIEATRVTDGGTSKGGSYGQESSAGPDLALLSGRTVWNGDGIRQVLRRRDSSRVRRHGHRWRILAALVRHRDLHPKAHRENLELPKRHARTNRLRPHCWWFAC